MRRPKAAASTLLILAIPVQLACGGAVPETATIGGRAPAFRLPSLAGGELDSESLAGRPVILNFWATWCQPCRKEFPVLAALDRDPRVEVVTIALDEGGAAVVGPFARRMGLAYPVLLGDQETFERFGGFAIPYTLVLDRHHTVVNTYRGPATRDELEADLRRMPGESADG